MSNKIEEKYGNFIGWKVLSDNTLQGYTKKELIEIIRMLEYNWNGAEKTIDQQAKNFEKLMKENEILQNQNQETTVRVSIR